MYDRHKAMLGNKFREGLDPWNKGQACLSIRGKNHPNWKGGREYSRGYIKIIDHTHPFADKRGRIFEHRVVMENTIGRYLESGEVVHHINGIKDDNRPENLRVCKTAGQHIKIEHPEKIAPHWHYFVCENCKKDFRLTGKETHSKGGRFCCYQCFNDWRTPKKPCKESGCGSKIHARGLCSKHYRSLLRRIRKLTN